VIDDSSAASFAGLGVPSEVTRGFYHANPALLDPTVRPALAESAKKSADASEEASALATQGGGSLS